MSGHSLRSSEKSRATISQKEDTLSKTSLSTKSGTSKTESEVSIAVINPLANVVTFDYSFGYDCKRPFNLCVAEDNILVYYSGTLIHIFNYEENTFSFRRSYSGSGIGHIVKSPTEPHLAIGEKCVNPMIVIYEWPSFRLLSKMSGGTVRGYSHLGYSPDGTMLVSQGKEPDHLITIWDWKQAQIILRVKSHGQDVFNVEFSQFVPGQLTSCGLGHVKFWKMAKTFTGLKLQGELGRFGKTELCDIQGICAMPDEKVISGSEWGNLLVWEDRLIKLEVKQKAKGNCHNGDISQIHFNPITEDIISVGMDGWIKMWNRVTIDGADPPDEEDWYLEMQPLLEVHVKDDLGEAKLMSLSKKNSDSEDNDWFGQDANGCIWSVSLNEEGPSPRRLFLCHAGSVAAMATSPVGHYLATLSSDGCLLIYDTTATRKILLTHRKFQSAGTALIWLPINVEATGAVIVGGFADGMLRMIVVSLREVERALRSSNLQNKEISTYINIIQRVKSHTAPVTAISLNPRGSILISGSEDFTIFIYQILPKREYIVLVPVGYVQLSGSITYITWRPKKNATAIVACGDGSLTEVELPEKSSSDSDVTYNIQVEKESLQFKSIKSELIRAQEIREIEIVKEAKVERKRAELEKIKDDNPNLDIDEELFLIDSDEEVEFPPLYYPESASPILFVMLLPSNNFLLSMGGYDCGFLYEYASGTTGPINSIPVPDALNIPLHCYIPICEGRVIALGMANGVVRLVSCHEDKLNMEQYYDIAMHDPEHGVIYHLCSSHDGKRLFSCGADGNVFMYIVDPSLLDNQEEDERKTYHLSKRASLGISGSIPRDVVMDADGRKELSLEETKRNAQQLHKQKVANEHKENIYRKLQKLQLKFEYVLNKNNMLPNSQRLPHSEFELDPRITAALEEKITTDRNLMSRQMAFKVARFRLLVKKMQNHFIDNIACLDITVRAIQNESLRVKAFTHNKLSQAFLDAEYELRQTFALPSVASEQTFGVSSRGTGSRSTVPRQSVGGSLFRVQNFYEKLTLKARKALLKQQVVKIKREWHDRQWQIFLELKPDINEDDPGDMDEYEKAARTIGDFNLKSADTYKVPPEQRVTPAQKYWQMLKLHREIYETKEAFNEKVCDIRGSKISLVRRFKQLYHDLDMIQEEITPELRKERLPTPKCYLHNNFPDHIFRLEFGLDPLTYHPFSDPYDEEYFVLQLKDAEPVSVESCRNDVAFECQSILTVDDSDTLWEHQLKIMRMTRILHKQDNIIKEMKEGIMQFDEKLEKLCIDRLTYARDIKLMEIFYLTLYQELVIINSYAGREHEIQQRINTAIQLRNDKIRQKMVVQDTIDLKQQDISLFQIKLADLQEHVDESTLNTKFAKFLIRIFKKKRTSKTMDDSESESSSSEDLSDEDFDDQDDEDFIPIKLDENICPDGCDQNLYDSIVSSRNQRYEMEENISELRKQLEKYVKEMQVFNTELNRLDLDVQNTTKELEAVQFEKQQKLNNVETVVVLNLSQFQHFVSTSHPEYGLVPKPLVFHSEVLFKLSNRIPELEKETEEEQVRIKQQKLLMQRLNKRCKEMEDIKKALKIKIGEELIYKFGEKLDVNKMEEYITRKMVNQARRDHEVDLLRKKYDKIMLKAKNELWIQTEALIKVQRENTRLLKLQTMLEHETCTLNHVLRAQEVKRDKVITVEELEVYEKDLKNLEKVLQEQLKVKEELKNEIRGLSYKCTPPEGKMKQRKIAISHDIVDSEVHGIEEDKKYEESLEQDVTSLSSHGGGEEAESIDQVSYKTLSTIDNILDRLASGASGYEVAVAVVNDLLQFPHDEKQKSSALECAFQLIDQLIQITTEEDVDNVSLVEQLTESLLKMTRETDKESQIKSMEYETDILDSHIIPDVLED